MANPCDNCKFVFLRQDKVNRGTERNPVYLVQDVFYCEKCLAYRRVDVEKHTPRTDSFDMYVERLK